MCIILIRKIHLFNITSWLQLQWILLRYLEVCCRASITWGRENLNLLGDTLRWVGVQEGGKEKDQHSRPGWEKEGFHGLTISRICSPQVPGGLQDQLQLCTSPLWWTWTPPSTRRGLSSDPGAASTKGTPIKVLLRQKRTPWSGSSVQPMIQSHGRRWVVLVWVSHQMPGLLPCSRYNHQT